MSDAPNVQDEVTKLAMDLAARGVPLEQIADWLLVTGAGVLEQARGPAFVASRLENLIRKIRDPKATNAMDARHH